jgi:hypothetical protein
MPLPRIEEPSTQSLAFAEPSLLQLVHPEEAVDAAVGRDLLLGHVAPRAVALVVAHLLQLGGRPRLAPCHHLLVARGGAGGVSAERVKDAAVLGGGRGAGGDLVQDERRSMREACSVPI